MESRDKSEPLRLEFRYDPQGRRITKTVYESTTVQGSIRWAKTHQSHYIYDSWNLIAETDEAGNTIRTHLWGLDLSGTLQGAGGVGGLIGTTNNETGNTSVALYDGNGNVVEYRDTATDQRLATFDYDPFGGSAKKGVVTDFEGTFRFSTKYEDFESGLYYYGFRYYNRETGRWLNRDPIMEHGGFNLYEFISSNPIHKVDYLGMEESGGVVSGIPDILLMSTPTQFNCPTPLQNLQPFQINMMACGRECTRRRGSISGQIGDCFDSSGNLISQVITGLSANTSTYWSLFCCCRNGRVTISVTFAGQDFEGSGKVDVDAWFRGMMP